MAYKVIKGWPSEGALDMNITLDTEGTVTAGFGGMLDTAGKGAVGTFNVSGADAANLPFFCIDVDAVKGTVLGLMSACVIEIDADHYEAASYVAGKSVSLKAGKFDLIAIDGSDLRPVVGRVYAYDAVNAKLTILWDPKAQQELIDVAE